MWGLKICLTCIRWYSCCLAAKPLCLLCLQFKKEQQKQEGRDLKKQTSRTEKNREDRIARLKHKEAKEAAAAARYAAEEEVVANHLAQLIGDAEWLKSFLADVLRTQAEEYQACPHVELSWVFLVVLFHFVYDSFI